MTSRIVRHWFWRICSLIFFIAVLGLIIFAGREYLADRKMFAQGFTTTAFVERMESFSGSGRYKLSARHYATVTYELNGEGYRQRLRVNNFSFEHIVEGETTTVIYQADNPFAVYLWNGQTEREVMQNHLARLLIGGFLFLFSLFGLWATILRRRPALPYV